jgi:beta-lactamase family protein
LSKNAVFQNPDWPSGNALQAGRAGCDKNASDLLLGIMQKQQVNDRFPPTWRICEIAHKSGDGQSSVGSDVGIIWVKNQPIIVPTYKRHSVEARLRSIDHFESHKTQHSNS